MLTKDELIFLLQLMDTVGDNIPEIKDDKHFDSIKTFVDSVIVNATIWEYDNGN